MNAAELKEVLDDAEAAGVDLTEVEIRYAHQPSWPFQYSVAHASVVTLKKAFVIDTEEEWDVYNLDKVDTESEEFNAFWEDLSGEESMTRWPQAYPGQGAAPAVLIISEGSQASYLSPILAKEIEWS